MKVRIKDSRFGLAIREGDSAEHASLLFIAERIAADGVIAADTLSTDENGALPPRTTAG